MLSGIVAVDSDCVFGHMPCTFIGLKVITVSHHRWSSYLEKDLKMKIQTLNEQAGGLRSAGSEGIKLSYIFKVGWDTSGFLFQVASR